MKIFSNTLENYVTLRDNLCNERIYKIVYDRQCPLILTSRIVEGVDAFSILYIPYFTVKETP